MKPIKTLFTILFISLLSSPSWSVTLGDLVEREGIYYEKFTDVPFSGKVTGSEQGSFKNGVNALDTLVEVMHSSQSDSARIAAATAILDRGYGKPSMTQVDHSTGHVITAFEVVADYQESDFAE